MIASLLENIRVALIGLRSNKLRAALTMLGITIGVSAVIVLVSLGQAVDTFVRNQFLGLGTNLVLISPAANSRRDSAPDAAGSACTQRPCPRSRRALCCAAVEPDASGGI